MVVFFLGSQGGTLKFYLEGAKTIQVCLGEDLALNFCCRRGDVFLKAVNLDASDNWCETGIFSVFIGCTDGCSECGT